MTDCFASIVHKVTFYFSVDDTFDKAQCHQQNLQKIRLLLICVFAANKKASYAPTRETWTPRTEIKLKAPPARTVLKIKADA